MTDVNDRTVAEAGTGTGTAAAAPPSAPVRALAGTGIALTVLCVVTVLTLHVVPPTSAISPVRRTISEYGLSSLSWAFNLGVVALAAGSAAVLAAQLGRFRSASRTGLVFGAVWIVALLVLVVFPKHNWAVGPSTSGTVHRMASLVAFLVLPFAVLLLQWRRARAGSALARWGCGLAVLGLAWFLPIAVAIATRSVSGLPWWQAVPLGLVERGMAASEVAAVIVVGVDALRRRPVTPDPRPAAG
ncbi:DUF998 domain-containing protein [Nakamurella endophytica]|uniref:DUF998 domain-containing protein n=1 Tax=Nakamurella endophytica TaxID=1748367 RepID=UPI001E61F2B1|nr:DUF998 domain-containing protein [Nakamurella endophytica]